MDLPDKISDTACDYLCAAIDIQIIRELFTDIRNVTGDGHIPGLLESNG
jgi:hypothetical protein